MADRFLYMPMIGVALILAAALEGIGVFRARIPALATAVAVVSALAWRTMEEEAFWRDGETLWAETVRRNPTSPGAWINLGGELLKYGDDSRLQEAGNAFARAVNLTKGKSASAFAGLSLAATRAGDFAKAAQFHRSAVALDARYAEPHKFEQALIYTPAEILQLTAVALRSSHHL